MQYFQLSAALLPSSLAKTLLQLPAPHSLMLIRLALICAAPLSSNLATPHCHCSLAHSNLPGLASHEQLSSQPLLCSAQLILAECRMPIQGGSTLDCGTASLRCGTLWYSAMQMPKLLTLCSSCCTKACNHMCQQYRYSSASAELSSACYRGLGYD